MLQMTGQNRFDRLDRQPAAYSFFIKKEEMITIVLRNGNNPSAPFAPKTNTSPPSPDSGQKF